MCADAVSEILRRNSGLWIRSWRNPIRLFVQNRHTLAQRAAADQIDDLVLGDPRDVSLEAALLRIEVVEPLTISIEKADPDLLRDVVHAVDADGPAVRQVPMNARVDQRTYSSDETMPRAPISGERFSQQLHVRMLGAHVIGATVSRKRPRNQSRSAVALLLVAIAACHEPLDAEVNGRRLVLLEEGRPIPLFDREQQPVIRVPGRRTTFRLILDPADGDSHELATDVVHQDDADFL